MGRLDQATPASNQNTSYAGDLATSVGTGALQLPSVATGLLDIAAAPFGGDRPFSRGADRLGDITGLDFDKWAGERNQYLTPETQAAKANVDAAEGFGGTLRALAQNPRAIGTTIAEAIPSTLAGGVAGAGVKAGAGALALGRANAAIAAGRGAGVGAPVLSALQKGYVAGGIGEGAVSSGYAMSGIDESVDPKRAALASVGAGAAVGLLGGLGGAASRKVGLTDPDLIFVGGRAQLQPGVARKGLVKRVLGGAVAEGVFEEMPQSAVETIATNWAEGRPEFEGIGKAAVEGMIAGMGMGGAANILGAKGPPKEKKGKPGGETSRVEGQPFVGPPDPIKAKPAKELIANWIQLGYMLDREKSGINDPDTIKSLEEARKRGAAEIKERGYTQDIIDQAKTKMDYEKLRNQLDTAVANQDGLELVNETKANANRTLIETVSKKVADLEKVYPNLNQEFGQDQFNDKFEELSRLRDKEAREMKSKNGRKAKKTREQIALRKRELALLKAQGNYSYTGDVDLTPKATAARPAPAAAPAAAAAEATPAEAAPEQVVEDTTVDLSNEALSDEDFLAQMDNMEAFADTEPTAAAVAAAGTFGAEDPGTSTDPTSAIKPEAEVTTEQPVVEETTPAAAVAAEPATTPEPLTEQPVAELPTPAEAEAAAVVGEETVPANQTPEQALEAEIAQKMPAIVQAPKRVKKVKGQPLPPTPSVEEFFADGETKRTPAMEKNLTKLESQLDDQAFVNVLDTVEKLEKAVEARERPASKRGAAEYDKLAAQAEFARQYLETVRGDELGQFMQSAQGKLGKPLTQDEMMGMLNVAQANMSEQQKDFLGRWLQVAMLDDEPNPYGKIAAQLEKEGNRTKNGKPHDIKNIRKQVAKGLVAIEDAVMLLRGLTSRYQAQELLGPYRQKAIGLTGKDSVWSLKKALGEALGKRNETTIDPETGLEVTIATDEAKNIREQLRLMKDMKWLYTGEHWTSDADSSFLDRKMQEAGSGPGFAAAGRSIQEAGLREEDNPSGSAFGVIGAAELSAAETARALNLTPGTVSLAQAKLLNDFSEKLRILEAPEGGLGSIATEQAKLDTLLRTQNNKAGMLDEARDSPAYPKADKIWSAVGKELGDETSFDVIDDNPAALNLWLMSLEQLETQLTNAESELDTDSRISDPKVKDRILRDLKKRLNEGLRQSYQAAQSATKGAALERRIEDQTRKVYNLTAGRAELIKRRTKLVDQMRERSDAARAEMEARTPSPGVFDNSIGAAMTPEQRTTAVAMGKSLGITQDKPTYATVEKTPTVKPPMSLAQAKKQPLIAPKIAAMRAENKQGTYWPAQPEGQRSEATTVGKDDLIYTMRRDEDGTGWELWRTRSPVGYIEETRDVLIDSSAMHSGKFNRDTIKNIVSGYQAARTFNVDVATRKPKSQTPTKTADQVAADLKRKKDNRPQSFEEGIKNVSKDMDVVAQAQAADEAAQLAADANKVKVTRKRVKPAKAEPRPPQVRESSRMLEDYSYNWGKVMAGTIHAYGADLSTMDLYAAPEVAAEMDDRAVTLTKMTVDELYEQAAYIYAENSGGSMDDAMAKVRRVPAKAVQAATKALTERGSVSAPTINIADGIVEGLDRANAVFAQTDSQPIYVAVVDTVEGAKARRDMYTKSNRKFSYPGERGSAAPEILSLTEREERSKRDKEQASREAMWKAQAAEAEAKSKTVRESVPQRAVTNPSNVAQVTEELKPFMPRGNKARIRIIQSFAHIERFLANHDIDVSHSAGGFVYNGEVFLIANNINVGEAPGVLMHEVGVHLGMTAAQVHSFARAIENMATNGDATAQFAIGSAYNAVDSQTGAGASMNQLDIDHEVVAYFVQDAVNNGVLPTNLGQQATGMQNFFRNLMNFVRAALQAFGFRADALTAQHLVDAAYGAANTAMRTPQNNSKELRLMLANSRESVSRYYDEWAEGPGRYSWNTLKKYTRKLTGMFMFSQDFADWVSEQMPVARKYFDIVARRQAIRGDMDAQLQRIVDPLDKMSPADRQQINQYMVQSQYEQAWGYTPHEGALNPDKRSAVLEKMYNAMNDQQKEAVFKVFQYADKLQQMQQEALRDEIIKSNAYLLENDALSIEDQVALETDLTRDLDEFDKKFRERRTAWLPLRRHGNYAVVFMSDKLKQAMLENSSDATALRADENHYWVEFTQTNNKAQALADDLKGRMREPGEVTHFEREQMMTKTELIPFNFMNSLRANIERNTTRDEYGRVIDQPTSSQMDAWTKLYISQLSETSIRKSELTRDEVGGFDQDMIRGFVQYGSAVGGTISGIKLNHETHEVLNEIRAAARDGGANRDRLSEIKNEILVRHGQNINADPNPLTEGVLATTSFWMLLSSPAYYLQNSTQPWMLTLPVLGGRFGLTRSANAMYTAYGQIQRAWSATHEGTLSTKLSGELADLESIRQEVGEDKYQVLMDLKNRGLFDVGVAADFGSFDNDSGKVVQLVNGVHRKMIHAVRSVEVFNRGVTALAAYDLASSTLPEELPMRVNDKGDRVRMTAREYALETVMTTQGDYSGHNAPSIIRRLGGIGKVMTQFRKFQLIQIGLLTRLVKASFNKSDAYERSMARIQLGYIVGAHTAAGGILGLPAANLAGMAITAAFGDDDDPDDFETMMRRGIGDSAMADLILKGLPAFANVDVSAKIGMGNTFAILPYTEFEMSRDGAAITMAALFGGPAGGQLMRWADSVGMMQDGNMAAGFTEALPRGLRDAGRAILYATRGVERKNAYRDVAIPASELSWFDISSQAVGLPSTTLSKRQDANAGLNRSKEFFKGKSTEIKALYIEGRKEKDLSKIREAREQWRQLQDGRQKVGFARQDFNLLTTSYRDKLKRERSMRYGVLTEKTNEDYVDVFFE